MFEKLKERKYQKYGMYTAAAVAGIFALVVLAQTFSLTKDSLISAVLPSVLFEKTNEARETHGVHPLFSHDDLDRAAQLKAEHMATHGYFAHFAPDGTSPWHWFRSAGYSYLRAGENLALHFSGSERIVNAWMQSPTHRENLLDVAYLHVGFGVATGTYEGSNVTYVVQLFGLPQPQSF